MSQLPRPVGAHERQDTGAPRRKAIPLGSVADQNVLRRADAGALHSICRPRGSGFWMPTPGSLAANM
ncbi:hypothetical protein [Rhizobium leguminosarum]|uniref:hypothetical protein n=1 Tax=Rhizobium leguminosarum TaxID=384 RepID=UPI001FD8D2EC|nr:hypothetical protein [Rhizobium leguminosarum]